PRGKTAAGGAGDLEVTLTHLLFSEQRRTPALAVGGQIKFPTAHNSLIGTGKTDYTAYAIATKQLDRLALHANLGYTVVGRPAGTKLRNIIGYALAEELHLSPRLDVVGGVIGS